MMPYEISKSYQTRFSNHLQGKALTHIMSQLLMKQHLNPNGDTKMTEQVIETFTLAQLCEELGIKPQGARVKLRKRLGKEEGDSFRWTFPLSQKDEIIALLTAKAAA